jgi:hypothetical protein
MVSPVFVLEFLVGAKNADHIIAMPAFNCTNSVNIAHINSTMATKRSHAVLME